MKTLSEKFEYVDNLCGEVVGRIRNQYNKIEQIQDEITIQEGILMIAIKYALRTQVHNSILDHIEGIDVFCTKHKSDNVRISVEVKWDKKLQRHTTDKVEFVIERLLNRRFTKDCVKIYMITV